MSLKSLLLLFLFTGSISLADVVNTTDGARLVGTITGLSEGKMTLETAYAGTLIIDTAQVRSFTSDNPLFVRLESGNTMSGVVQTGASNQIQIRNQDGTMSTNMERVAAVWTPEGRDPEVVALEKEAEANRRKWSYSVAGTISGSGGNTEESNFGLRAEAKLEGSNDTLLFYGRYNRSENNGNTTADETIGGIRFDSFVYKDLGWYARVELENDPFEELDLRTVVAGGVTYRFLNQDHHSLVGRTGFAYRYRSFSNGNDQEEPILDMGLTHEFIGNEFWKINSDLTYGPSFEDFGDYLLSLDSVLEIPLPDKYWNLGLGMSADYTSVPPAGVDEVDYTWFAALILNWN